MNQTISIINTVMITQVLLFTFFFVPFYFSSQKKPSIFSIIIFFPTIILLFIVEWFCVKDIEYDILENLFFKKVKK